MNSPRRRRRRRSRGKTARHARPDRQPRDCRARPPRPGALSQRPAPGRRAGPGGSRWADSTSPPGSSAPASSWPPPCTRASTPGFPPSRTTGPSSISGTPAGTARSSQNGYPEVLPTDEAGNVQENAWAFYALFPVLGRVVAGLTGHAPGVRADAHRHGLRAGRGPGHLQPLPAQGVPPHCALGNGVRRHFSGLAGAPGAVRRVPEPAPAGRRAAAGGGTPVPVGDARGGADVPVPADRRSVRGDGGAAVPLPGCGRLLGGRGPQRAEGAAGSVRQPGTSGRRAAQRRRSSGRWPG